jgi:dimethylaniline monooxygenase (N-oxide forming)
VTADGETGAARRRLAIIGCGSSGLITLKSALAELPGWEIVCFERTGQITGCWGNPYPGFVSTSTKYTTQFACFPERDAAVEPDAGQSRAEFYRDAEYGEYLRRFADAFRLHGHIKLHHEVAQLVRASHGGGWSLTYRNAETLEPSNTITEHFDAVVICTGLAAQLREIESPISTLPLAELNSLDGIGKIRQERIVVFGGGESAVDYAARLSQPELGNQVYLSLRTGVRVSPRYHPIRGVPSDFLRNRLMLSIHPALRNWIGQRFVEARILHQEQFEKWFPSRRLKDVATSPNMPDSPDTPEAQEQVREIRKQWAYKLTKAAKDELFNMFHNKSDDFLDCVARGRVQIVGSPVDDRLERFYHFESQERIDIQPTKILPAIGYRSTLAAIAGNVLRLSDFFLGCCHVRHPDLFLVGFARPIIGNIPTISEMQATYVCGLISGRFSRPENLGELNSLDQRRNAARFAKLDLEAVYPVEMFDYCDRLARAMNAYPSLGGAGSLRSWWQMQLSPATTAHYYYHDPRIRSFFERAPVYMPRLLILLLLLLKPIDWSFRAMHWLRRSPTTR